MEHTLSLTAGQLFAVGAGLAAGGASLLGLAFRFVVQVGGHLHRLETTLDSMQVGLHNLQAKIDAIADKIVEIDRRLAAVEERLR